MQRNIKEDHERELQKLRDTINMLERQLLEKEDELLDELCSKRNLEHCRITAEGLRKRLEIVEKENKVLKERIQILEERKEHASSPTTGGLKKLQRHVIYCSHVPKGCQAGSLLAKEREGNSTNLELNLENINSAVGGDLVSKALFRKSGQVIETPQNVTRKFAVKEQVSLMNELHKQEEIENLSHNSMHIEKSFVGRQDV